MERLANVTRTVTVGTPPQEQVCILDTGSSNLYFDASSAPACQTNGAYSCKGGTFTPGKSSTYKLVEPAPAFETEFGDGSTASGPYASDTVCLSDVCLSNVEFGVAEQVKSTTGYALGVLGLGYSVGEVTRHVYPNMPEVLVDAGEIDSRLYSVYLNSLQATSGSILFGGVDVDKYTGNLVTLDILPELIIQGGNEFITKAVQRFITTVTDFSTTVSGKTNRLWSGGSPGIGAYKANDNSLPVLLDTGSSAWSVPESYYPYIVRNFPYVDRNGLCKCSDVNQDDSITLTFGGKVDITVPASQFIVPIYNRTTNAPYEFPSGGDQCAFMIVSSKGTGEGFDTLGDAILRSMYVVFDLDNAQVSIAQAKLDSTSSDIRPVKAGVNGVANAAKNVQTASVQSFSIPPTVSGSANYHVSTAKTTIGTATGTGAAPANAQAGATSTKSGVAAAVTIPRADWSGVWVAMASLSLLFLGAGVML
jgi:hypothetical protein